MRNIIANEILSHTPKYTEEYVLSIYNKIDSIIEYSQLPIVFQKENIDAKRLPAKTNQLLHSINEIVDSNSNIYVRFRTFKECGFLTALCMSSVIRKCILEDTHVPTMLYIDTNLLVEDYKRLMDINPYETNPIMVHSLDVLQREILNADYVFWDKFNLPTTNFALTKLYEIISIRYRNCLGNMFFTNISADDFARNNANIELRDVMNLVSIYNLDMEQDSYIH